MRVTRIGKGRSEGEKKVEEKEGAQRYKKQVPSDRDPDYKLKVLPFQWFQGFRL